MLFYDDELPPAPSDEETKLAQQLGQDGLEAIDARIERFTRARWLKVARIVLDVLKAGGFSAIYEAPIHLHVRRLIGLVNSGVLEAKGRI